MPQAWLMVYHQKNFSNGELHLAKNPHIKQWIVGSLHEKNKSNETRYCTTGLTMVQFASSPNLKNDRTSPYGKQSQLDFPTSVDAAAIFKE